jgi:hypothetical protein
VTSSSWFFVGYVTGLVVESALLMFFAWWDSGGKHRRKS